MFDAAVSGLVQVTAWPAIGYLLFGVLIGLLLGMIPGLSGLVGFSIMLPFTFVLDPVPALALLLGMFAVTTTSDTIASVLFGIPGTSASQATILDGHPMAMKGEASRAFGAAFSVSAVGGILGAIVLGLSIPVVKPLILYFAQPEIFMLSVFGMTIVGTLSGNSILLGLIAALAGLGLSYVGYAENGALPRYVFGTLYLLDGLPLIPVVLGLFAIPELIELAVQGGSISKVPREEVKGGLMTGVRDACRNWWLVLRSTAIGAYFGLMPGLGGTIVDWMAYGHAVQSSKNKGTFGKGDVRGVIAPETANNAMKGGALIPTVAFGIPGSPSMAVLLGAFMIQGVAPGPEMLTVKLDFTFALMWTLAIANFVGALLLLLIAGKLSLITFLSGRLLVPLVTLFIFLGAWTSSSNIGDWIVLMVFGMVGYMMKKGGVPRPPMVLGFVIGPIMENALFITTHAYEGLSWLSRPACLIIAVLCLVSVAVGIRRNAQKAESSQIAIESPRSDPTMSLAIVGLLLAFSIYGLTPTYSWAADVGRIPMLTFVPAVFMSLTALLLGVWRFRQTLTNGEDIFPNKSDLGRVFQLWLWLLGIVFVTIAVGQLFALPMFIALYFLTVTRYAWWVALLSAVGTWIFLYVIFDRTIGVVWYPALLF
ncbi:MAG: tripartite tricarboxylate transporter permease [Rhodobacteraceae bacterium]|nr:tripartite tricarboxylate transporter permease [Paracoccaceae bacterium]